MPTLTAPQMAALQAKITGGDISGFYADLYGYGDQYAKLAGAVTDKSSWQGELAIGFAQSGAGDNSVNLAYGGTAWNNLNRDIAQAYLNQYDTNGGVTPDWEQIQDIHNEEYDDAGLDANDWFPNKMLDESGNPASLWADFLSNDGAGDLLQDGFVVAQAGAKLLYGPYLLSQALTEGTVDANELKFAKAFGDGLLGLSDAAATAMLGDLTPGPLKDLADLLSQLPQAARSMLPDLSGGLSDPASLWDRITPPWLDDPWTNFGNAFGANSPLVLDLDGDGVELTVFDSGTTTTFFDVDGDGFAEHTAWVDGDDGLLAIDLNENGRIDGGELFGTATIDGFARLAQLDGNGDHVINQFDEAWSDLVIWKDADEDAVTDTGELISLATLDIVSIDLAGVTPSTSTISGNKISHTGTFKYDNGDTDAIVDAWFVHNKVNSFYADDFTFDLRTLFLPTLRGFGQLPDLHVVMSADGALLALVENFATSWDYSRFEDHAAMDDEVTEILFAWAGVGDETPGSRGPFIDASRLAFLEKFFGETFIQQGYTSSPGANAARALNEAYEQIFHHAKAALIVQAGGASIFGGTISYDPWAGAFTGDMDILQAAVDDLETAASQGGVDEVEFWKGVAEFIAFAKGLDNVTVTEAGWLDDAIFNTNATLTWEGIQLAAVPAWYGLDVPGSVEDDTINGTSAGEPLYGGAGNDEIFGHGGNDELYGGTGDDILQGGDGDDLIYGEAGNDELHAYIGEDELYGGDGDDELYGSSDANILDGGDGHDVIIAYGGNDEIYSGLGGNFVYGGSGDDTYYYQGGDDVYGDTSGTDVIVMSTGIVLGDLVLSRQIKYPLDYDTLLIQVDEQGTIELEDFFYANGQYYNNTINTLLFSDTSTFDLLDIDQITTYGSEGADYVYGVYYDGYNYADDTIYGLGGDDFLRGGDGNDVLDGGVGNDDLRGEAGDDVYYAGPGFDVIEDSAGNDTIILPEGYDDSDVSFLRTSAHPSHLLITITGLGQIRIENQFFDWADIQVETLEFHDTTTIDLTDLSVETIGTSGNDNLTYIYNGASANDIFDGREGDDSLSGQAGDDTYYFSEGTDTVYEYGGTDVVAFREGLTPANVSVYRGGYYFTDLYFEDSLGNKLIVPYQFQYTDYQIESIVFGDTTTWSISTTEVETRGTSGADYINAVTTGDASEADTIYALGGNDQAYGGNGNDLIFGGDGNDTISGGEDNDILHGEAGDDYLSGEGGNDTFVYTEGLDSVLDSGGTDTLLIANGLTISDITIANHSTYDAKITVNASVDEITIYYLRYHSSSYHVESIAFSDGFSTTLTDYNSWSWGTSGNNSLSGTSGHDTLIGLAGDDTLSGAADNDNIHGGEGADTLSGGNGADLLHGGIGDDILYGGDGLDTLFGGAGEDTFILEAASAFNNVDIIKDFVANDDDAIDISDVLDGYYTHGVDVLTDFVEITTNGSNSELRVDTTGMASFGSGTLIAIIENVTGLTNEATLVTNGNLLVA
jgi:Ca2+-binding RTX toxin-like protein